MKKLAMFLVALAAVLEAQAATVVLTGGKRLTVARYAVGGSYVTVQYSNGRQESYPLAAVDLAATRAASGEKAPVQAPAADAGPHSPFFGAKSAGKPGGLVVTDADVKHIETEANAEEGEKKDEDVITGGQVVLVGYEKKAAGKGQWDVTATVANQGKTPVSNVSALMRVLDVAGKPITTGSGTLLSRLEPGKQGTITARILFEGDPAQVAIDLTWQEIKAVAKPSPTPALGAPKPSGQALAAPGTAPAAGWSVPAGSPPNTMPSNMMAVVPPTTMGTAPQVPPQPTTPK